ncbi:hypothetical protein KC726_02045 [Candidatus Woesebacteria bacterium]|nr:hypothetical protein [Candidatus Woesebacteria bacterium]
MNITNEIVELLKIISLVNNQQIQNCLHVDNSAKLFSGSNLLTKIDNKQISVCGHNVLDKVLAKKDRLQRGVKDKGFSDFLNDIASSVLRLNHVGISYTVEHIMSEVAWYKKVTKNSGFDLFDEPSGDPSAKWLFVGSTDNWETPLFEIVLTKMSVVENMWRPHFHIDIDTDLNQKQLEDKLETYLGKDFVQWKLDIPDYGVVLEMGMLGSIDGTKIYLGVGTNLRNTRFHREKILQKV